MFWNKFIELCEMNNIKPNPLGKELGVSSASLTKWKNGAIPGAETLVKIADRFNVSVDYLLGRTEHTNCSGNIDSIITHGSDNIINSNNNNINQSDSNIARSDNNQKSLDETSVQVAEMFQNLDIQNKAKVLSYMIEVTK